MNNDRSERRRQESEGTIMEAGCRIHLRPQEAGRSHFKRPDPALKGAARAACARHRRELTISSGRAPTTRTGRHSPWLRGLLVLYRGESRPRGIGGRGASSKYNVLTKERAEFLLSARVTRVGRPRRCPQDDQARKRTESSSFPTGESSARVAREGLESLKGGSALRGLDVEPNPKDYNPQRRRAARAFDADCSWQ